MNNTLLLQYNILYMMCMLRHVHNLNCVCGKEKKRNIQKKKRKEKQIHTKKETKLRIQKQIIKNQTKQLL